MDGKAERRWLGTYSCDNERTIAWRTNALRAYKGMSSELIPTRPAVASRYNSIKLGKFCLLPKSDLLAFRGPESIVLLLVWETS